MRPFVKIIFCSMVLSFCGMQRSGAQQNYQPNSFYEKTIAPADSMLVKKYIDSVNNAGVFSRKRQRYFDSALAIKPWKASWWQQKGMPLMKQGKYEAGMRFLDSAVKYDALRYLDYRAFMKCIFQKSYVAAIKDFEVSKIIIGAGAVMDHTYDFLYRALLPSVRPAGFSGILSCADYQ